MNRKEYPEWLEHNLKIGLGQLAGYFLERLEHQKPMNPICVYCGHFIRKFARACPNCRNTIII